MKWIVFFGLIAAANSAAVYQRADIPVKVVYEKPAQTSYLRNLQAREQLSSEQIEYVDRKYAAGLRNLEARSQLSPELPEKEPLQPVAKIVTPNFPEVEVFNKIEEISYRPDQNIDDIYDKIQEIILSGANRIKKAAEAGKFGDNKAEVLSSVNATFEKFLEHTKGMLDLKATDELKQEQNQNFLQQMISSFQSFTSSVTSSFTNPSGAQNDEQPQNPLQAIMGQVQNGLQQVVSSFTGGGQSTQATVLGDSPATTAQPGPIQFAQNAFQQIQQNINNLIQPPTTTGAPGSQSDETTTQGGGPFQVFQNVFNQIGNLNPFQPTTKAPGAQNDATTQQTNPLGIIQGAVAAFNPFGQSTTQAPGASTSAPSNNPLQGIQTAGQNVISGVTSGTNPAQGFIDQANQSVGQITGAINQGGSPNPVETGQNIASQIGEAVQGANPGQLAGQIGSAITGNQKVSESKPEEVDEELSSNAVVDENHDERLEKEDKLDEKHEEQLVNKEETERE